jgi:hypothetical protein
MWLALALIVILWKVLNVSALGYFRILPMPFWPRDEAKYILRDGRLAELPASARCVRAYRWHGLFTGEDYLRFEAAPEDIERFISDSPSISRAAVQRFDAQHMYLPRDPTRKWWYGDRQHEYYWPHPAAPSWYDTAIRVKGRFFEVPGDPDLRGHNSGSVVIDDETHVVYVYIMWS